MKQPKYLFLLLFLLGMGIFLPVSALYADSDAAFSPEEAKQFVKQAVIYALENKDPHMDYGKYVSPDFINHVDENTFDFNQWTAHQKHIKSIVKSMKPEFRDMVSDGNTVGAVYFIHLIKNDGSKLDVKDIALFMIKNHKITRVEELTHLVKGNPQDKNIGSLK